MSVNGRNYDWEDLLVRLPHGESVALTEISYKDGQDIEPRYGRGAIPRGYGRKNYEASGSMTLDREEFDRLAKGLTATGGGIYDHAPFAIVVSYANADMGTVVDTLAGCKLTSFDASGSQGNANVGAVKCEFKILEPIKWNGLAAKVASSALATT